MIKNLSQELINNLKSKKMTISFAESCTGGLMASTLVSVSGASSVFEYGFIVYSAKAKNEILNVSLETIKNKGIVSKEVAHEMANGALLKSGASIAISVTGCAGPGKDDEGNEEGTICFGFSIKNTFTITEKVNIEGNSRNEIRLNCVKYAFNRANKLLKNL